MTTLTHTTAQQRILAAMAAHLAEANPDAAAELARHLAHEAARRKRVRFDGGAGLVIRYNAITNTMEIQQGD
jgi:hypothetical protein